ncbi:uncharacterized protein HD556DRAFT_1447068 [Suillus plorans]|uniref:Uncharacterized protein n=1 Tax=Suillus plorans TaxID=116603 RepID=A0A9P7AIC6_9AGAM|nr:uncharacterized protein HD556DRAFT_1447068 [Suillus plorans]KAG1789454.1 hypothetical protein HD556DRAFT_1447068 [Suillus plorans]
MGRRKTCIKNRLKNLHKNPPKVKSQAPELVKLYRSGPRVHKMEDMEKHVSACLDDIPLLQIRRYANRSARFMDAYTKGLTGPQAVWATRKYHGHRVVPNSILEALDTAGKI